MSLVNASKIALYGFCGIAGPESFENTLGKNGMILTGFKAFADHHSYSADDIRLLLDNARTSGASALITTEKDMVKLRNIFPVDFNLLALPVQLQFGEDFDRFVTDRLTTIQD